MLSGLAVVLAVIPCMVWTLSATGKINTKLRSEIMLRYQSWLIIIPLITIPILLGAFWTILALGLLSLFCYREYARVTGLMREKWVSFLIVIGIVLLILTTLDHWYLLFVAMISLTVTSIVAFAVIQDRPSGYIQRVALAVFGYLLFGVCLGHLSYLANDTHYRSMILLVFLAVELNDVFAFCCGKSFGRRKLCPNTSPNKTVGGALGAIVLTTLLVAVLGHFLFAGTRVGQLPHLIALGVLISISGQFGDLTLSSIKRDIGVKDTSHLLPGHGGMLDRIDSLTFTAPLYFHLLALFALKTY